jgi:hypothetical protein
LPMKTLYVMRNDSDAKGVMRVSPKQVLVLTNALKGLHMKKRISLLAVVLVIVCVYGSAALALDPIGPPIARLEKGHWSIGVDYLVEDSDAELDDAKPTGFVSPFKMNVEEQLVTANVAYGIADNWEIFLRLGSELSGEGTGTQAGSRVTFDGDSGFVTGLGVRASLYKQGNLELGGLFQIGWGKSDGNIKTQGQSFSVDGNTTEIEVAMGPNYKINESVSIYGGPFLYFIDGDIDGTVMGTDISYDIDEDSYFGGYIGTQIDITDGTAFNIEWQHTATADGLGMGLVWRF